MEDKLTIKCGFACNNNCIFCGCMENIRKYNKTTEQITALLKENSSRNEVLFSGGEPTIRKDIFKLANYAKILGYKTIKLQTNGRMLSYMDFCKKAISAGFNSFSISLNSADEKMHDFLTGSRGSFKQINEGIRNLQKLKQELFIQIVILKQNYKELPRITKFLIDNGISNFQFSFVMPLGKANKNFELVVPRIDAAIEYLKESLVLAQKHKKNLTLDAVPICLLDNCNNEARDDYFFHPKTEIPGFLTDNINKKNLNKPNKLSQLLEKEVLINLKELFNALLDENKKKINDCAEKTANLIKKSNMNARIVNSLYYFIDIALLAEKNIYNFFRENQLKKAELSHQYHELKRMMESNISCFFDFDFNKLDSMFKANDLLYKSIGSLEKNAESEKLKYLSGLIDSFGREIILINNLQPEQYQI